jgi:hypothetical protein
MMLVSYYLEPLEPGMLWHGDNKLYQGMFQSGPPLLLIHITTVCRTHESHHKWNYLNPNWDQQTNSHPT